MERIAVIGAGASGCFCAVNVKVARPDAELTLYEAASGPMAKLALTGGGRCNLTNTFSGVDSLRDVYPRGFNLMKRVLSAFSPADCREWFENEGVRLYSQEDGRVFPESDDAGEIVNLLSNRMRGTGVELHCRHKVIGIRKEDSFILDFDGRPSVAADAVVVASGGGTAELLGGLGLKTVPQVPSLFSFRINNDALRSLTGTVVPEAALGFAGTNFKSSGELLLTDWGVSGPSVLRLSSYAARWLADAGYKADLTVNWTGTGENEVREWLMKTAAANGLKQVSSIHPEGISGRVWKHILSRAGIRDGLRWSELGGKSVNRCIASMTADLYGMVGRCRFKDEFVTCGGVDLSEVNASTMEARRCPGLFLTGEVLDIDAVTGGFNLQAAWSTAYVAGKAISERFPSHF